MGNGHSSSTALDGNDSGEGSDGGAASSGKGKRLHRKGSKHSKGKISPSCSIKEEKDCLKQLFDKLSAQSMAQNPHLPENTVSKDIFEGAFDGPLHLFGKLLFGTIIQHSGRDHMTKDCFVKQGRKVMELFTEEAKDRFYFYLFSEGKDEMTCDELERMIEDTYAITMSEAHFHYEKTDFDAQILGSIATGVLAFRRSINFADFDRWKHRHCPQLFEAVHTFVMNHLTAAHKIKHPALSRRCSVPKMSSADVSHEMSKALLWALGSVLPSLFTLNGNGGPSDSESSREGSERASSPPPLTSRASLLSMSRMVHIKRIQGWTRLYNSTEDGMSFNRLKTSVLDYRGPTCLFVSFEGRNAFCVALDTEWRDSPQLWGESDCMCLQLLPVYRLVENSEKLICFNLSSRAVERGIRVGSDPKNLILDINYSMDTVKSFGVSYNLQKIEVWGCAGKEIREAQVKQRQWEHREAEKMRETRVKLEAWDSNPDRQLLEWGGISNHYATDSVR